MILFLQIPITDIRLFIEQETGRIPLPLWPTPQPNDEFMRSFGAIQRREFGGIKGWVGENEICDSTNAVKLSQSLMSKDMRFYSDDGKKFYLKCDSRYFYFDGLAIAKLEMVFLSNPSNISLSSESLLNCLKRILSFNVIIPKSGKDKANVPLISSGKYLASHYLYSSTRNNYLSYINKKWTIPGAPLLWIEASSNDNITPPNTATRINEKPRRKTQLYHWWLSVHGKEISVWFANCPSDSPANSQVSRTMRMMLMRLHSEQISLRTVIKAIETNEIRPQQNIKTETPASKSLQNYLNEATRRVFKLNPSTKKYFEPQGIGLAVRESLEKINPGQRYSLYKKLEDLRVRPQIKNKVGIFMDQQIFIEKVIMGDENINNGQTGVVGRNAHAENMNFSQTVNLIEEKIDLSQLAEELAKIRNEMKKTANGLEQEVAIGAIAAAEQEAKNNNRQKVMENLKTGGKWALGIAKEIGVSVATLAIQQALGLHN